MRIVAVAAAGAAYFALAFAAGFLLGSARVLLLAPRIGETMAVLAELPVMLALCWIIARWSIARFDIAPRPAPRLAMGAIAFVLLMLAEFAVSTLGFGRTAVGHFARYADGAALLGLAGQILFALFPAIRLAVPGATRRER